MPMVDLHPACYTALEQMKAELVDEKKKAHKPSRTTFSEVVALLLRKEGRLPK